MVDDVFVDSKHCTFSTQAWQSNYGVLSLLGDVSTEIKCDLFFQWYWDRQRLEKTETQRSSVAEQLCIELP